MDDKEINTLTKKGKEKLLPSLPLNCQPLSHQVAGHFYGKGKSKLGTIKKFDLNTLFHKLITIVLFRIVTNR
jgi:hypothetical protein